MIFMGNLHQYFATIFPVMALSDLNKFFHWSVPEHVQKSCHISTFSVPLATGYGAAVLVEPRFLDPQGMETTQPLNGQGLQALCVGLHDLNDLRLFSEWPLITLMASKGIAFLGILWDGHGNHESSQLEFQSALRSCSLVLRRIYEPKENTLPCFLLGHCTGSLLTFFAAVKPYALPCLKGVVVLSPVIHGAAQGRRGYQWSSTFSRKWKPKALRTRFAIPLNLQLHHITHQLFHQTALLRHVSVPVLWMEGVKNKVTPIKKIYEIMQTVQSGLFIYHDPYKNHQLLPLSPAVQKAIVNFMERILCHDDQL